MSTRGQAPVLEFDDALLAGLARDGGLYVPESWPKLRPPRGAGPSYAELAVEVMAPFVGERIERMAFTRLVEQAYRRFRHPAIAPLRQLGERLWLMDLAQGPTLAFKDMALQLVGLLFDHVLARKGARATLIGATSGDTGSAAIEACRDRAALDVFILFPHGRVSEVQRRQMTTVDAPNVHCIAVEGAFDDCQDLVKAMFNDAAFRDAVRMAAVNSINWARVMAQIVYYVRAAVELGCAETGVSFAVPTGNFGNILAAYVAGRMGLPVDRLMIGSNRNDILARLIETGEMRMAPVEPSLSPSMDIQVSSNFERLLFELLGRDGAAVAKTLTRFRAEGAFSPPADALAVMKKTFGAVRRDDQQTLADIGRIYRETGELVDPHTAIGVAAAQACVGEVATPVVALATAHPAKFPDAVERATGVRPALPEHVADLRQRAERFTLMPADLGAIQRFVRERAGLAGAA